MRFTNEEMMELERMIPDLEGVLTQNPIHQVYFRAGMLAARALIAKHIEEKLELNLPGDSFIDEEELTGKIAQFTREIWWDESLGDDPGQPRKFDFKELASYNEETGRVGAPAQELTASVEALPIALGFLHYVKDNVY